MTADEIVVRLPLGVLVQPAGEPLVQLGARRLGQRRVGGVADQHVAEPQRLLARAGRARRRTDQALADQRPAAGGDLVGRWPRARRPRPGRRPARSPSRPQHGPLGAESRSSRAVSSAVIVGGISAGRSRAPPSPAAAAAARVPSSTSIASSCSTNSGFPPAALPNPGAGSAAAPPPSRPLVRVSTSSSRNGSSSADTALVRPAPQPGWSSRNSGRAKTSHQDRRVPRPVTDPFSTATSPGSAQCRSSTTSTTGRSARQCLQQPLHRPRGVLRRSRSPTEPGHRRDPLHHLGRVWQSPRAARPARLRASLPRARRRSAPAACRTASHQRPVGHPLRRRTGTARAAPSPPRLERPARNSAASRDFPMPAGPSTVASWQVRSLAARSNACRSSASSRARPPAAAPVGRLPASSSRTASRR